MNRPNTAILDFDGTIAESMYIWDEWPGELIRRQGGTPPEDLVRAIAPMVIDEALPGCATGACRARKCLSLSASCMT